MFYITVKYVIVLPLYQWDKVLWHDMCNKTMSPFYIDPAHSRICVSLISGIDQGPAIKLSWTEAF